MKRRFARNLKFIRKKRGYTQAQLAKLLFIDRTTLTKYETGSYEPSLDTLRKMCEVLRVDYNTLLDGPRKRKNNSQNQENKT